MGFTFFSHALISARSEAGFKMDGPNAWSSSMRLTISMDSGMAKPSAGISRMGASFLPISLVGVGMSSLAMKTRL